MSNKNIQLGLWRIWTLWLPVVAVLLINRLSSREWHEIVHFLHDQASGRRHVPNTRREQNTNSTILQGCGRCQVSINMIKWNWCFPAAMLALFNGKSRKLTYCMFYIFYVLQQVGFHESILFFLLACCFLFVCYCFSLILVFWLFFIFSMKPYILCAAGAITIYVYLYIYTYVQCISYAHMSNTLATHICIYYT